MHFQKCYDKSQEKALQHILVRTTNNTRCAEQRENIIEVEGKGLTSIGYGHDKDVNVYHGHVTQGRRGSIVDKQKEVPWWPFDLLFII